MKHLRKFPDDETRDEILADIEYGVLSYTEGSGINIKPEGSDQNIPADDEIWYTTNTGTALPDECIHNDRIFQVVEDLYDNTNPLTLISNTYSNGKGILKFDRSVGALGGSIIQDNYTDEQYVTSVVLPESFAYAYSSTFSGCESAEITSYGTMNGYDWKVPPM